MRRSVILTTAAFFALGAAAAAFAQSLPPVRPYIPGPYDDPRYDPRDAPAPQGQPLDQQQQQQSS